MIPNDSSDRPLSSSSPSSCSHSRRPPRSFLDRLLRPVQIGMRRRPLLPFLLVATIALDLALNLVWDLLFPLMGVVPFLSPLFCGLLVPLLASNMLYQCCLLGVWVVYQWEGASYRLGIAALLLGLMAYRFQFSGFGAAAPSIFTSAGITVLCITIGRLVICRASLVFPRFRVATLLQLTTSVAIIATFARYFSYEFYFDGLPFFIIYSLLVAALYGVRDWSRAFVVSSGLVVCAVLAQIGIVQIRSKEDIEIMQIIDEELRVILVACGAMLWLHGLKVRIVPLRNACKELKKWSF